MPKPIRVRFAPSPTGPLHIGGVRTALFNYLFAKKNNGTFFLRIEDTDQNRFVPGAEEYILEALNWLGIAPDETVGKNEKFGPYRQSERKELYQQYANQLILSGNAYYAFDTAEDLDAQRKHCEEQGKTFIYNHHNREQLDTSLVLSKEATDQRIAAGDDYVIRFKTPVNETLHLKDIIRGDVKFETNLLDDKVLFKSDGMPTYHLANIVDDHLMETSHVIRGEEWLPSMPLHVLLYRAFGWEAPEFAHLPLILKPIGNGKLSKRDGDKMGFPVFPLEWKTEEGVASGYRENGFFPEAVVNFLALLGWNDGTEQEIFSLEELVQKFDLNRIHKAGAKFDPEKNWVIVIDGKDAGGYMVTEDAGTVKLDRMFLLPEYQGKGIGSHIVQNILEEVAAKGKKLTLTVIKHNARVLPFYERLGLRVVGENEERFVLSS